MSERIRQSPEAVSKKPLTKPDLRNALDAQMRVDAKKLLEKEAFRQKLSGENLEKFMKDHSADNYTDYKKWNKDFLEQVMGLKDLTPVQERIHILALQELLNKEKGGFTEKQGKADSLDGKFGKFTLSRMAEYLSKQTETTKNDDKKEDKPSAPQTDQPAEKKNPEPTPLQAKETAPGVVSRLSEGEKYGKDETFYAGDSIMVGIIGKRVEGPQKSAAASSHLVKTARYDKKWYRKDKIFVEEEAMKFLENKKCKMLVINGGINDLSARGRTDKVRDQIMDTYKKIIDQAHKKGIKVTIYAVNDESGAQANGTKSIYKWLVEKSGADVVVDSTKIADGRYARDGLHPQAAAYRDLYKSLDFLRALA